MLDGQLPDYTSKQFPWHQKLKPVAAPQLSHFSQFFFQYATNGDNLIVGFFILL